MSAKGRTVEHEPIMSPIGDITPAGPLTPDERAVLKACEATIAENLGAWVNTTNAMIEIVERRLYRETHPTFESYLADTWGVSRAHGHRLILHARVQRSPVGERIRNESQARELASLLDDTELLVKVVDRAEEIRNGKPLTAAALRQARLELALPPEEAAKTRAIFELAEWTEESGREWQERSLRFVNRLVEGLPADRWPEAYAALQRPRQLTTQKAQREAFVRALRLIAYDAPLTEEVLRFLQAGTEVVGVTPISLFTDMIQRAGRPSRVSLEQLLTMLAQRTKDAEFEQATRDMLADLRVGSSSVLRMVTDRMAEVVVALAQTPQLATRTRTTEEIEQALAWYATAETYTWADGPTLATATEATAMASAAVYRVLAVVSDTFLPEGQRPEVLTDPHHRELVEQVFQAVERRAEEQAS